MKAACLVFLTLLTCSCTSDPVAAFRAQRDVICEEGSDDITALNAVLEAASASAEVQADVFEQIGARIRRAQEQLDQLSVPEGMIAFVDADAQRRTERIQLLEQLAAAIGGGDEEAAAVEAELTALNLETEAEEDANGLWHCP